MRRFGFAVMVVLAGCSALPGQPDPNARPQSARLSETLLTVSLSDGTICRAEWRAAGGAGRLEPCGQGFGYAVKEVQNPNILRQLFTSLTKALGAEGSVPPMAEVVITDAAGIDTVFVSPPPVE